MASFGNASGPVPPFALGILGAKGSLYVTRADAVHAHRDARGDAGDGRRPVRRGRQRQGEDPTSTSATRWPTWRRRTATSRRARPPARSSSCRRREPEDAAGRFRGRHRAQLPMMTMSPAPSGSGAAPGLSATLATAAAAAAALTAASVLVPIVEHPNALTVLFTRRTAHLKAHSGQVSFPGGRAEPDGPDAGVHRAARDAGGDRPRAGARARCSARLSEYLTRTGFRVTPVVGARRPPLELAPDAREVARSVRGAALLSARSAKPPAPSREIEGERSPSTRSTYASASSGARPRACWSTSTARSATAPRPWAS